MKAKRPKLREWDGCLAIFDEGVPHGENFDNDWCGTFAARIFRKGGCWHVEVFPGFPNSMSYKDYAVQRRDVVDNVKRILQAYLQGYYDRGGD